MNHWTVLKHDLHVFGFFFSHVSALYLGMQSDSTAVVKTEHLNNSWMNDECSTDTHGSHMMYPNDFGGRLW